MAKSTALRLWPGLSAAALWTALLPATAQTVTPFSVASLAGSDIAPHRDAGLAGNFDIPNLPACRQLIALDGRADNTDWQQGACNTHFSRAYTDVSLTVTHKMFAFHTRWQNGATGSVAPDELFVYLDMTDNTNDATSDFVVLMLNTPTGVGGLCFRRDKKLFRVSSATTTCPGTTPPVIPGLNDTGACATQRACIVEFGNHWAVEVKLVPSDFGISGFGVYGDRVVRSVVRGVDAAGFTAIGPANGTAPTIGTPSTWAAFTMGTALDVALVLDLSGSMGVTKLNMLKDAVEFFVNDYRDFAWQSDRITVRYFQTNVTTFPDAGGVLNLLENPCPGSASPCWKTVSDNVGSKSSGDLTALGGGLQSAFNLLTAQSMGPGRKPITVLFSDGMQNVNPMVLEIPEVPPDPAGGNTSLDLQIANDNTPGRPSSNVTPLGTRLDAAGIITHTIGLAIDATSRFITDMYKIAKETGGQPTNTFDPNTDGLFQTFLSTLVTTMSSRSPQVVAYRRGVLRGDSAVEVFTVNRGVDRLLLQLTRPRETRVGLEVFKAGKSVTPAGHTETGAFYNSFLIDLPDTLAGDSIVAEGDWTLVIKGEPGTPYQVSAVVEEPRLKYELSTKEAEHLVGDPIHLTAQVTIAGVPVDDARVTAIVGRPGQGIGTLLSVTPTPTRPPAVKPEPGASAAQIKLQSLLEDDELRKSLQPVDRTIELRSLGSGKYEAAFSETSIPGSYPVLFQIQGNSSAIGSYRRTHTFSVDVRFGAADTAVSDLRIRTVAHTAEGRQAILPLRPKDRFANFLGPDFGNQITVTLTAGTVGTDIRDLLDGAYEIPLQLPAAGDPEITITVVGHLLYKGPVSGLEEGGAPPVFGASLHAGVSIPHGAFGNSLNTGFGITADLAYHLRGRPVDFELLAGFHRFGGEGSNPDVKLYHLSGSGKLFLTPGRRAVWVEAGVGAYDLSPGPTDPGIHAGAGVQFNLWRRAALEGLYRLHSVFTSGSNATFSSIQVGGRVRF